MEKNKIYFKGVEFIVIRRKVKYSRIIYDRVAPKIILPRGLNPIKMLELNEKRIEKKIKKHFDEIEEAKSIETCQYQSDEFDKMFNHILLSHSKYLDLEVGIIKFRKMKRRWGTCYSDGKIILNSVIKQLPQELISFIIFHEILHLNILSHCREFKSIMQERFPDYKQKQYLLRLYGIKLLGK